MHIHFHTLEYKNLLSVGNNPVKISLDDQPITLFHGTNGEGKSTFIEALYYALYGKPFRKIKVGDLVNNVNKNGLFVSIGFTIGKTEYKVERGIKPKIFNIYKNGKLLDQEASSIEFQKELEYTILKMSPETFKQIVVLGSSSYIPYMRLTKTARDSIIEDLLDIQVFSTMQKVIGDKNKSAKRSLVEIGHSIDLTNNTINTTNQHIAQLQANNEKVNQDKTEQLERLQEALSGLYEKQQTAVDTISKIDFDAKKLTEKKSARDDLLTKRSNFNSSKQRAEKESTFFTGNLTCPTCTQKIEETFRDAKIIQLTEAASDYDKKSKDIDAILKKADENISKYAEKQTALRELKSAEQNIVQRINSTLVDIDKLSDSAFIDVEPSIEKVKSLTEEVAQLNQEKNDVLMLIEEYSFIQDVLNTTGIKSSIVRTYLPVINGIISDYLEILEFDAEFIFDDTFTETIQAQGRDSITYNGLSDGQKMRIDLSLLFAFRDVSKIKNSTSTNLVVFDEIGDNSLDEAGLDALLRIFEELSGKHGVNIYIISHNEDLQTNEKVSASYTVQKVSGFTEHARD